MPVSFKKIERPARRVRGGSYDKAAVVLSGAVTGIQASGVRDTRQTMHLLNEGGYVAPSGGKFSYGATRMLLQRLAALGLALGPRTLSQAQSGKIRPYKQRKPSLFSGLKNRAALARILASLPKSAGDGLEGHGPDIPPDMPDISADTV